MPPTIARSENRSQLTSASLIQSPYLFCFAALCKADEDEELYLLPDEKTRYVTGNVVSSLYHLKDPSDGSAEGFFVFPGECHVLAFSGAAMRCPPLYAGRGAVLRLRSLLTLADIGVRVEGTFRLKLSLYEMVE
jgi:hypothetical protein